MFNNNPTHCRIEKENPENGNKNRTNLTGPNLLRPDVSCSDWCDGGPGHGRCN